MTALTRRDAKRKKPMHIDSEHVFQAALQLRESERLAMISRLLETLPADDEGLSLDDEDLVAELDRRFADPEGAIPWTDLRAEG